MSKAEPYVAFAIHTFALVIGGLLCLIINWSHIAADTGQSEWKVIYRAVLIAASLTFIFGFFFNFFVPRDVIDRYRLALSEEREGWHRFLPRAAYGMLFSSYRWCFGIFALITSQLFNLHQSSIV